MLMRAVTALMLSYALAGAVAAQEATGDAPRPYEVIRAEILAGLEATREGNRRLAALIAYQVELLDTLEEDPDFFLDRAAPTDLCPDGRLCELFPWTSGLEGGR